MVDTDTAGFCVRRVGGGLVGVRQQSTIPSLDYILSVWSAIGGGCAVDQRPRGFRSFAAVRAAVRARQPAGADGPARPRSAWIDSIGWRCRPLVGGMVSIVAQKIRQRWFRDALMRAAIEAVGETGRNLLGSVNRESAIAVFTQLLPVRGSEHG